MNIDLNDPIFRTDIEHEAEYAEQGWKTFYAMYFQLQNQGAPPELLERVVEINHLYKELGERLADIKQCFPEGGRR